MTDSICFCGTLLFLKNDDNDTFSLFIGSNKRESRNQKEIRVFSNQFGRRDLKTQIHGGCGSSQDSRSKLRFLWFKERILRFEDDTGAKTIVHVIHIVVGENCITLFVLYRESYDTYYIVLSNIENRSSNACAARTRMFWFGVGGGCGFKLTLSLGTWKTTLVAS